MASVKQRFKTAPRPRGARAGGVDPRGGEDLAESGQAASPRGGAKSANRPDANKQKKKGTR
jgi:hypothetical protein